MNEFFDDGSSFDLMDSLNGDRPPSPWNNTYPIDEHDTSELLRRALPFLHPTVTAARFKDSANIYPMDTDKARLRGDGTVEVNKDGKQYLVRTQELRSFVETTGMYPDADDPLTQAYKEERAKKVPDYNTLARYEQEALKRSVGIIHEFDAVIAKLKEKGMKVPDYSRLVVGNSSQPYLVTVTELVPGAIQLMENWGGGRFTDEAKQIPGLSDKLNDTLIQLTSVFGQAAKDDRLPSDILVGKWGQFVAVQQETGEPEIVYVDLDPYNREKEDQREDLKWGLSRMHEQVITQLPRATPLRHHTDPRLRKIGQNAA